MADTERRPAGPRGSVGALAEDAAAAYLSGLGWQVLGRNLRVGADELDIVALEPGRPTLVIVEVRSRSGSLFGSAIESVDARKVTRLYRAVLTLRRHGHPRIGSEMVALRSWRVDVLALVRGSSGRWEVEHHLRGLAPP